MRKLQSYELLQADEDVRLKDADLCLKLNLRREPVKDGFGLYAEC